MKITSELQNIDDAIILKNYPLMEIVEIHSTRIPPSFFNNLLIKSVIFGPEVEIIEKRAFENCKELTSITFDQNARVTTIGDSAFRNCKKLTEITLPEKLENIDFHKVFEGCDLLTTISMVNGNGKFVSENNIIFTKDKKIMLFNPNMKTVQNFKIGEQVTEIGKRFFEGSELEYVILPNNLEIIHQMAFYSNLELKRIIIPQTTKRIKTLGFAGSEELFASTSMIL